MDTGQQHLIRIATSCKDSDYIPKVTNAGEIVRPVSPAKPYQVMHNGLKVYLDSHYGDFNTEIIYRLRGHHEPQEEKVFYEVLRAIPPNGTMLELGSFWAYYSMWFNLVIPGARNVMVEPMLEVLRHGESNFKLNGLKGDFVQACVGKESVDRVQFKHWDGTHHGLPQVSVDDLLKRMSIAYLDILHVDIQGAEYDMLQGARGSISAGRIGFIFISTHLEKIHRECREFLKRAGYRSVAEHTMWESHVPDGLIVVAHPKIDFAQIRISKRRYWHRIRYRIASAFRRFTSSKID